MKCRKGLVLSLLESQTIDCFDGNQSEGFVHKTQQERLATVFAPRIRGPSSTTVGGRDHTNPLQNFFILGLIAGFGLGQILRGF